MLILIPLVFVLGLFIIVQLSVGLSARRRAGIVITSLALSFIGLPITFELGRISESYRRDTEIAMAERDADGRPVEIEEVPASPETTAGPSPVRVLDCLDPRIDLDQRTRQALADTGMTRVSMPFGVLLAADERMPIPYVEQSAAVLAEMLDQDQDGEPDDPDLIALLADRSVAWLAMPVDEDAWERDQLPKLEPMLGYDIVIPAWWLEPVPGGPDDHGRAVIVEEIHHFITQFGLSRLHPAIFGVDDWTSVIARETRRAQCDFWQHPENDCPGSPAEYSGECGDPNCDVVEFYQQVVVLRAGMEPGWRGIGFPRDAEELDALLGEEIKSAIDDPGLHQLRRPLEFDYPVTSSPDPR